MIYLFLYLKIWWWVNLDLTTQNNLQKWAPFVEWITRNRTPLFRWPSSMAKDWTFVPAWSWNQPWWERRGWARRIFSLAKHFAFEMDPCASALPMGQDGALSCPWRELIFWVLLPCLLFRPWRTQPTWRSWPFMPESTVTLPRIALHSSIWVSSVWTTLLLFPLCSPLNTSMLLALLVWLAMLLWLRWDNLSLTTTSDTPSLISIVPLSGGPTRCGCCSRRKSVATLISVGVWSLMTHFSMSFVTLLIKIAILTLYYFRFHSILIPKNLTTTNQTHKFHNLRSIKH